MSETKKYIEKLFNAHHIVVGKSKNLMFDEFITNESNTALVKVILENQKMIMDKWKLSARIRDIMEQSVKIPNATVGKQYEAHIDFINLGWDDVIYSSIENIEQYGLTYNNETEIITGVPTQSGDFKITLNFKISGEPEDSLPNTKQISLIINADPKSLWKNIPSNKEDVYWKEDNVSDFKKLGTKNIVVASKRGRSHANVGSFRDDDFAFKHFENSGWSVIAVSDGAGSAKVSRKGSELACSAVINYFEKNLTKELLADFDKLVEIHYNNSKNSVANNGLDENEVEKGESNSNKISKFIYNYLGGAAKNAYQVLEDFATKNNFSIKDLHSTLIFSLVKKYEFGYVILSFGVGDCPIGLLNKDLTEIKLMNWLDVGEFGGGTRFITMPEIFTSDKFSTRFGFKLIEDFSYLILMTDGIYDPKFVVEANLEKLEKWTDFLADLKGDNADGTKVDFDAGNNEIANQLSLWMDFWSPGNHDDRTLVIVF